MAAQNRGSGDSRGGGVLAVADPPITRKKKRIYTVLRLVNSSVRGRSLGGRELRTGFEWGGPMRAARIVGRKSKSE
jgi:hypothetical protein